MRLLLAKRSVSRTLALQPKVRRIIARKPRSEPPAMMPLQNLQTCVEVRRSRGAILGQWFRGFNEENEILRKKSSPQNLWISLLIVLRSNANSTANSRLTPGCLFIGHREQPRCNHNIWWWSSNVYVLAFIFVRRSRVFSLWLWIRILFIRPSQMALDLCTEACRIRRKSSAPGSKICAGRGEQNSQENDLRMG